MNDTILLITISANKRPFEDIGICYLASYMREQGNNVKVICTPELSEEDFNEFCDMNPILIGFSMYDSSRDKVLEYSKEFKSRLTEVTIITGSVWASNNYDNILNDSEHIDYVCIGEAEMTLQEIVEKLKNKESLKGIKGIAFKENGEIVLEEKRPLNKKIDIFPEMCRDVYFENNLKYASIITSRGCVNRCSFCSIIHFEKLCRFRSVDSVLNEIKYLYEKGIKYFQFQDAAFDAGGVKRLYAIAEGIDKLGIKISYRVNASIKIAEILSKEKRLLNLLKKTGLIAFGTGIESFDEFDLQVFNKKANRKRNIQYIEFCLKNDIVPFMSFILFHPYTTFKSLKTNIKYLKKYKYAYRFSILHTIYIPANGTDLYDRLERENYLVDSESSKIGYKFVDERVYRFWDYIANNLTNYYTDIHYLDATILFFGIFKDFYHRFEYKNNKKAYKVVQKLEKNGNRILKRISNKNAKWYNVLLEKFEKNASEEEINRAIEKIYNNKQQVKDLTELKNIYLSLVPSILECGEKYKTWVKDIEFEEIFS